MQFRHRLFFALKPPLAEARRIGLARDGLGITSGAVSNDRLHVTIGITQDYASLPGDVVHHAMRIGDGISGDPFDLCLDRLSAGAESVALRPSRRPPALTMLQKRIDALLTYWGVRRADWRFSPHVTLGYRPGPVSLEAVAPIAWQVREVVLIHSIVGATRHIELGRWPLVRHQLELF
jgi:RNA 2',3'-cyclic 3'-phosphodiesterase